jgi:DNA gyrase inhibitor GyrI
VRHARPTPNPRGSESHVDDPAALGLESGTLPGGRYLRARLRGEPPEVYERIGPTFEALVKTAHPDSTRPSIEFYRQRDEIDLLLPVADSPAPTN